MSRVTAPISKLARSINTATAGHGLLDAHASSHGSVLSPKYAELLNKRHAHDVEARSMTTTHRPTLQSKPSRSQNRPLMQTFASVSAAPVSGPASFMPVLPYLSNDEIDFKSMRMPLLPDSYTTRHNVTETPVAPLAQPLISVVAAMPGQVLPASALTEVEGMGIDGVELRFAHNPEPARAEHSMLKMF